MPDKYNSGIAETCCGIKLLWDWGTPLFSDILDCVRYYEKLEELTTTVNILGKLMDEKNKELDKLIAENINHGLDT